MPAPVTNGYRSAYEMTLAPVVLFFPAFWLAGMGPCTFSHPIIMLIAAILFVTLEIAALRVFLRGFRFSLFTAAGTGLAVFILFASLYLTYVIWIDVL